MVAAAAARELQAIDATCPLVTKVHREATRFAGQNKHRMNPCAKVFREGGNSIKRNTIPYTETINQQGHFAKPFLPAADAVAEEARVAFVDGDGLACAASHPCRMKPEFVHLAHSAAAAKNALAKSRRLLSCWSAECHSVYRYACGLPV